MKRLIILLLPLLLAACIFPPVQRKFPEVPKELRQACPDLLLVEPTTSLTEVIGTVTSNYKQYHECRVQVDGWIEWYDKQKEIFESVK